MSRPDFDQLFECASTQQGLFTLKQAAEAGYSKALVQHHLHARRFIRVQRGIYRLRHFPLGEHEDVTAVWLWSDHTGVFSLRTALFFHELSDALPAKTYLAVPTSWRKRRIEVPPGLVLQYADVPDHDRSWYDIVPVTSPKRTLEDCAIEGVGLETLGQAVEQALSRGLVSRDEIPNAISALNADTRHEVAA